MNSAQVADRNVGSMTNHLQTYSALQCLLVFQTLAAHRPNSEAFNQLSVSLKKNPFFTQENASPDNDLLDSSTLHDLFNRTVSASSRWTPSARSQMSNGDTLPTVADPRSASTSNAAAALVPMLYEEYKRRIIQDIRVEESKYDQLVKEIKLLDTDTTPDARAAAAFTSVPRNTKEPHNIGVTPQADAGIPPGQNSPQPETQSDKDALKSSGDVSPPSNNQSLRRRANASISSIINHDEPSDEKFPRPSTAGSGAAPTPTFPREPPYASAAVQHAISQMPAASPSKHRNSRNAPDLQQAPSPGPAAPFPHLSSRSPTSPIVLPPPPGMTPFPPTTPYSPVASNTNTSTYRRPAPHHPGHSYHPQEPYAPPRYAEPYPDSYQAQTDTHHPSSGGRAHQRQSLSQHQPHSPVYSAGLPSQYGQRGGVMLPPFQITSQSPGPSHVSPSSRPFSDQPGLPSQPLSNVSDRAHTYGGRYTHPAVQTPTSTAHALSFSTSRASHLHDPGVTVSPASATRWRIFPSAQDNERYPPRSVSPVSDQETTPLPTKSVNPGRGRKGKAAKAAPSMRSVGSSRGPHPRSQSASSHMSETIATAGGRKAGRKVKHEQPSTPVAASATDDNETESGSTVKPTKRMQSGKRRRGDLDAVAGLPPLRDSHVVPTAMQAPDTVVAYRNFSRMAQPVMNIISSHKHASLFAEPVRERQAEGYRDIIKRPQDLKSVRAAIGAGSRAVAAAVDVQQSTPGSASGSSGSNAVILPVSEALVPPKGIVNAAQLEQEIMRMFANAVMFNPGEDEIVEDTREMFASVEQALQQWRAVERMEETDEVAKEEEDTGGGSTKRRRL